MNLSLYTLASEYAAALASLPETGLDEQTIADTLEGLQGAVEVKAQNVAAYVLNVDAEAEAIDTAIAKLSERRDALKKRTASLRGYLMFNMKRSGITEIKALDGTFSAKIKQNPAAVEIVDLPSIPADFQRVIPEKREPDKAKIKEALKAGQDVPGCRLTHGERLELK